MHCQRMWSAQNLAEARPDILVSLAKSSVSSGLTARNQKFALVAPHMDKRSNNWVSLTQRTRWKSTCCCRHPRPSPLVGQQEGEDHLTKQLLQVSTLSQPWSSSIPPGWTPPPFHTWVLPWCTWMWVCSQLFVHRRVHIIQTLWTRRCKCCPGTPSHVLRASCSRGWLQRLRVVPKQTAVA